MINSRFLFLFIFVTGSCQLIGQELLSPTDYFSPKTNSYITLSDKSLLEGKIKDIERREGIIRTIKIEDGEGKKQKIRAESIRHMYLAPSKKKDANSHTSSRSKRTVNKASEKSHQELLDDGFLLFENVLVEEKKKKMVLLMQLLNPEFSEQVRVYANPILKESGAVGFGGLTIAGGYAKSYFIKVGKEIGKKIERKNYKKEFDSLWKNCEALIRNTSDPDWRDLANHILQYSACD